MNTELVLQGRRLQANDIEAIQRLLAEHPEWTRTRLSREICERWEWRAPAGHVKDMACRAMLRKLEGLGHIRLPAPRSGQGRRPPRDTPHDRTPVIGALSDLRPVRVEEVSDRPERGLFACLLNRYHYLGFSRAVGENRRYLAFDRRDRPLACVLFGSAAWSLAPRDRFIGWDAATRRDRLSMLTNNTRFLILPWVRVPCLASHLLGLVSRRVGADWRRRYGHEVCLLETFVDRSRFAGVCYQAANWRCLGSTTGRTRNGDNAPRTTRKDIYVYPLHASFRRRLRDPRVVPSPGG